MYVVYQTPLETDISQKPLLIAAFLMKCDAVTFIKSQVFADGYEILEMADGWSHWMEMREKMEKAVDTSNATC